LREEFRVTAQSGLVKNNIEIVDSIDQADLAWLIAGWNWLGEDLASDVPKICTVHHLVPSKFDINKFKERDKFIQEYHACSYKAKHDIKEKLSIIGSNKRVTVIPYWINLDFWRPRSITDLIKSRLDIGVPQDDYIIGSFQRDTEGHDLRSPKSEKGPDLFVEWVKKIRDYRGDALKLRGDKDIFVLLGGWRRQYVMRRLDEEGINYKLLELVDMNTLRDMYLSLDLYLVASRYEGGPQAILECAAMGIPIVSRDVGLSEAILPPSCIYDDMPVYEPDLVDVTIAQQRVMAYDIVDQIPLYEAYFKSVIANHRRRLVAS